MCEVFSELLALAAAYGWTFAIASVLLWRAGLIGGIWGFEVPKSIAYTMVPVLLIFTAGFFLAFRATYSKISN